MSEEIIDSGFLISEEESEEEWYADSAVSRKKPLKRLRLGRERDGTDRISTLPESVIVHILSFLPILNSIRTGVLSKRWQFLWTCVPSLYFNYLDIHDDYASDEEYRDADLVDFVEFADKTLVLCDGSVKNFGVNFGYEDRFASSVNLWTRFAARNGVQKFELDFHDSLPDEYLGLDGADVYQLPQFLYTNSTFTELRFSYCKVKPKATVAWNSLKKLSIGYVNLNDDAVIPRILGGTPLLEVLEIYYFEGLHSLQMGNSSVKKLILRGRFSYIANHPLEISAPNVQSLEVSGHYLNCHLVDIKSLVEAKISDFYLHYQTDDEFVNKTRGLLDSLTHVKTLTLGTWVIEGLAMLHTKHLSPRLLKCECLALDTKLWKSHPIGMGILLRYYPLLQSLIVTISTVHRAYLERDSSPLGIVEEKFSALPVPLNGFKLLRTVEFVGFWNYHEPVYQFVEVLLKNARMLQKMIIQMDTKDRYSPGVNESFKVAQKLLKFPRSSPNAELFVYE